MSIIESIILGIVQGLTEFLPISSTGHLTLAGKLMGLISETEPQRWTAFIAVIQIGTLIAIFAYFWKDIVNITLTFLKENLFARKQFKAQSPDSKLGWMIILGSVPVFIIGLGFKDFIEGAFTKNLFVISGSLIALGIILGIGEKIGKFRKEINEVTWIDAILIGFAQSLALIPGSSRSGTTITMGIFLGLKREAAARFSFLLSIPAVFGSGMLQFYESLEYLDNQGFIALAVATIFSAISGYLTIAFLLNYLRKNSTFIFVFYRIIIGLVILALIYFNIISA
ncbi:MAG: undecaprenyl-diphosphatase UppP [Ignavibacteriales bacterium]|nr:undecaprenyl-diphosphatase UppP [Ignavibacteriales bacterium]MCF8435984.1 undecaprenyl-diphosphatase UppP [Ignavibacteriales bacterium]